jgi:ribosomal protein L37E
MSAVRAGPVLPEDGVVRQSCATCGDQSFAVMLDALMCSSCGTIHKEDWQGAA